MGHTESSLEGVKVRKLGVLFVASASEAFHLGTAEQQRHEKEDNHHVEISRLPDSFEVMETHIIEASFCNSARKRFNLRRNKVQIFRFVTRRAI